VEKFAFSRHLVRALISTVANFSIATVTARASGMPALSNPVTKQVRCYLVLFLPQDWRLHRRKAWESVDCRE
jgi:hypothetical protein